MRSLTHTKPFRPRSYVCRNSRMTRAQERAFSTQGPTYGLPATEPSDIQQVFGRDAPTYLEIGFGSGQSLLSIARERPDINFIGIETHEPGIGSLLIGIEKHALTNIRYYRGDAIPIMEQAILQHSLAGVQIFFPDPWPKRRHLERRLIQTDFISLIRSRLTPVGTLHLATDWEDYAIHMMKVISANSDFKNPFGIGQFAPRSPFRPIITKFEQRGITEGRGIRELQFVVDN